MDFVHPQYLLTCLAGRRTMEEAQRTPWGAELGRGNCRCRPKMGWRWPTRNGLAFPSVSDGLRKDLAPVVGFFPILLSLDTEGICLRKRPACEKHPI